MKRKKLENEAKSQGLSTTSEINGHDNAEKKKATIAKEERDAAQKSSISNKSNKI